jgi:hypothetical protein
MSSNRIAIARAPLARGVSAQCTSGGLTPGGAVG